MQIAVLREAAPGETRVALIPREARRLADDGHEVVLERDAGRRASFRDADYEEAGARRGEGPADVLSGADVLLKVGPPVEREDGTREVEHLEPGTVLLGLLDPHGERETLEVLAERGVTALSMELLPRITRAQSMDALSSMATVAGYKAALVAADSVVKFFPMLTTAAGTIRPSTVLVLGAGVAGLQAIATCRRLGAEVEAFDIRPEVKEQVESLGADFLEWGEEPGEEVATEGGYAREVSDETEARERELIGRHVADADAVVTTAQVPGGRAPLLVTRAMVEDMRPGSVIVDLAGRSGGNCEVSEPGETVEHEGVVVHAPLNLPAALPFHASQMFARNVTSLLGHLLDEEGEIEIDLEDEIVDACCVVHDGEVRFGP